MADDVVLPILRTIQDGLAALDRKVTMLDGKVTDLDRKMTARGRALIDQARKDQRGRLEQGFVEVVGGTPFRPSGSRLPTRKYRDGEACVEATPDTGRQCAIGTHDA